jgi:hypothetical protein
MSSVTRFLRQIPTGQAVYGGNSYLEIAAAAVEFVPTAGNYVGNYPPGVVIRNPVLTAAVGAAIAGLAGQTPIIRDMGKTVFCPTNNATSASGVSAGTTSQNYGYFRQVQLLQPQPINGNQGFIGGLQGNAFGVYGSSPDQYTQYLTFYVPTSVAGVLVAGTAASTGLATTVAVLPDGPQGQM